MKTIISLLAACVIAAPRKAFGYGTLATNIEAAATGIEVPGAEANPSNITNINTLIAQVAALDATTTIPVGDLENIEINLARFRGLNDAIATSSDAAAASLKAVIATILANAAAARAGNKGAQAPE